ncbi:hypothetical protein G3A43_07310 [Paraburkholderia aspalathi]|nr:hypothetical protein [Paraburkholderia aspalathi]MBK3780061.1 hypothetical protein [Paraburkholderia aspalathi]
MKTQRGFASVLSAVVRAFFKTGFVIGLTVLAVVCVCEVVVRYPELLRLAPSTSAEPRSLGQFIAEILAFAVLYGFGLWRDWVRTLRNSVGMFGVAAAFLSISLYGFWLHHPNPDLKTGGQVAAVVSVVAFIVFAGWCLLQPAGES